MATFQFPRQLMNIQYVSHKCVSRTQWTAFLCSLSAD